MSVTIYHNPRCSKSRQALEILRANGIEPKLNEYLNNGLELPEIKEIFNFLKLDSALPMIRTKEDEYKKAGLSKDSTNGEFFAALTKHPKLLERPIVITDKGARICRPPELVHEIL